jgi:hypothetical protein
MSLTSWLCLEDDVTFSLFSISIIIFVLWVANLVDWASLPFLLLTVISNS